MKRILLQLALLALVNMPLHPQTSYWTESFDFGGEWTLQDNWHISEGKLHFFWHPQVLNFNLTALSPAIQLVSETETLKVRQYLEIYGSSSPSEMAEILLVAEGEEHLLWSHALSAGSWGAHTGSMLDLDVGDFAGQTVHLKFRTHGPATYQWSKWELFDLQLEATFANDLAAYAISGPTTVDADSGGTWALEVRNLGSQSQSSFNVSMYSQKFGDLLGTVNVEEPIYPQQSVEVAFEWLPDFEHNTLIYAELSSPLDEFSGNDVSSSHFLRVGPAFDFNVLLWNNDNGINTVTCPEQEDFVRPTVLLGRALSNAGINYNLVNSLPLDLSAYDIIIASLGCYCLS
jgi:hypothetical protein